MEQFKNRISQMSDKNLLKRQKELTKYANGVRKTIFNAKNTDRQEMYMTEYSTAVKKLNIVQEEIEKRHIDTKKSFFSKFASIFHKKEKQSAKIEQLNKSVEEKSKTEQKIEQKVEQKVEPIVEKKVEQQPIKQPRPSEYDEATDVLRCTDMLEFLNQETIRREDVDNIYELENTVSHKNAKKEATFTNLDEIEV